MQRRCPEGPPRAQAAARRPPSRWPAGWRWSWRWRYTPSAGPTLQATRWACSATTASPLSQGSQMEVKYLYVEVEVFQAPERPHSSASLVIDQDQSRSLFNISGGCHDNPPCAQRTCRQHNQPIPSTSNGYMDHPPCQQHRLCRMAHAPALDDRRLAARHGSSTSMSCHRLASSASSSHQACRPTTALVQPA